MDRRQFIEAGARGGVVVSGALGLQFLIGFGTQAALARLLEPAIFGGLAFASLVAMAINPLTNAHGDRFVVQQGGDPRRHLDVAFTVELALAAAACVACWLLAPWVMALLGRPELTFPVQLLAFSYLYNPLCRPRALFERQLSFARARFPFVAAQLGSTVLALTLALKGLGIGSLIAWRLATPALETAILWWLAPHRPRLHFDAAVVRRLRVFSVPLMGAALLTYFSYNVDYLIVEKALHGGTAQLGFYWLAFSTAAYFLKGRIILYSVLFPILSRVESASSRAKVFSLMTQAVGAAFLIPTLVVIFFGDALIRLAFGDAWGPAVVPFQITMVTVLCRAITANAGYFLHAHGITRVDLDIAVLYAVLIPPAAWYGTVTLGITGTALGILAVTLVATPYAFLRYIRPLTGQGPWYYFGRPVLLCLAGFALSWVAQRPQMPEATSWILLTTILAVCARAYLPLVREIRAALVRAAHGRP